MSKKVSIAAAMSGAAGKPSAKTQAPVIETAVADDAETVVEATGPRPGEPGYRIPSRQGKKLMALHTSPEAHRQVAVYAAQHGVRLEHVLKEAMNLWAESKGLPPIY